MCNLINTHTHTYSRYYYYTTRATYIHTVVLAGSTLLYSRNREIEKSRNLKFTFPNILTMVVGLRNSIIAGHVAPILYYIGTDFVLLQTVYCFCISNLYRYSVRAIFNSQTFRPVGHVVSYYTGSRSVEFCEATPLGLLIVPSRRAEDILVRTRDRPRPA